MDDLSRLVEEVNSILNSPYVVLLTPLHELLKRIESCIIVQWIDIKACQVAPLAAVVMAAIPSQTCGLPILATLLAFSDFRDAAVEMEADLLDGLLKQAVLDDSSSSKAAFRACVAVFSNPYKMALPASTTPFLEQVLLDMTHATDRNAISIARKILQSVSARALESVAGIKIQDVIARCKTVLSSKTDSHIELLNCVVIQGLVYQAFHPVPSQSTFGSRSTPSFLSNWAEKANSFFAPGERALKNVENAVLLAIHYSQTVKGIDRTEALEGLELVVHILGMVDPAVLRQYMNLRSGPSPNLAVKKLQQKAIHPALEVSHRFAALQVLLQLDPEAATLDHSSLVHECILPLLESPDPLIPGRVYCGGPDLATFKLAAGNLIGSTKLFFVPGSKDYDSKRTKSLLGKVLEIIVWECRPAVTPNISRMKFLKEAKVLVEGLEALIVREKASVMGDMLLEIVADTPIPDWWGCDWCKLLGKPSLCNNIAFCPQQIEKCRLEISLALSSMLIEAACLGGGKLSAINYKRLKNQVEVAISTKDEYWCHYNTAHKVCSAPYSLAASDNSGLGASVEWQEHLHKIIWNKGKETRKQIIDFMDRICFDLQNCSADVEGSLRAAREKTQLLQMESENANKRLEEEIKFNAHLQDRLEDMTKKAEGQETSLQARLSNLVSHHNHILRQVHQAEKDLAGAKETAKQQHDHFALKAKIELIAAIDNLEAKKKEASRLEVDVMWLREQIDALRAEMYGTHAAEMTQMMAVYEGDVQMERKHKEEIADAFHGAENKWATEKYQLKMELEEAKKRYDRVLAAVHGN